jgi:hypothetical protein
MHHSPLPNLLTFYNIQYAFLNGGGGGGELVHRKASTYTGQQTQKATDTHQYHEWESNPQS